MKAAVLIACLFLSGIGQAAAAQVCEPAEPIRVYMTGSEAALIDGDTAMARALAWAKLSGVNRIEVTGHTDTVGTSAANLALSKRRAELVARQLVQGGVPQRLIHIAWKGESEGHVPTPDNVRAPLNSLVEVFVIGAVDTCPANAQSPEVK